MKPIRFSGELRPKTYCDMELSEAKVIEAFVKLQAGLGADSDVHPLIADAYRLLALELQRLYKERSWDGVGLKA